MSKIALRCNLGLGDIVVMTAAMRELKQQHNFDLLPIVPIAYNTLLRGSPNFRSDIHYQTRLEYPDSLNCDPMAAGFYSYYEHKQHFVEYALDWFGQQLGVSLKTDNLRGSIYLTDQEKNNRPMAAPYWVIVAGGKLDATVKLYPHWQKVADGLKHLNLVQTKNGKDYHPPLTGVRQIETPYVRDFAKLIYHSAGVIAPVTAAVHIAGAFGKPAVVVAGGYEPEGWIKYPEQIVLNQFGLSCCQSQACFRKWAQPVAHARPHQECLDKVALPDMTFARCMFDLEPERIISAAQSLA